MGVKGQSGNKNSIYVTISDSGKMILCRDTATGKGERAGAGGGQKRVDRVKTNILHKN